MRQRFEKAPGTSFLGIGLQTMPTRGVEIDNNSGSWLLIPTLETYIPPYTIGWAAVFPYDVTSLDIIATTGPAGQKSTSRGTAVVVYLTNGVDMSPAAPGEPFIPTAENAGSLNAVAFISTAVPNPGSGTQDFVSPTVGTALRLYSATLSYDLFTPSAVGFSSPVQLAILRQSSSIALGIVEITPATPFAAFYFPSQGFDLNFQEKAQFSLVSLDQAMNVDFTLLYGLV